MKTYKLKRDDFEEEFELEDNDYLLTTAIDNLAQEIKMLRVSR